MAKKKRTGTKQLKGQTKIPIKAKRGPQPSVPSTYKKIGIKINPIYLKKIKTLLNKETFESRDQIIDEALKQYFSKK